jgi:predicted Zn-dependent protease
MRKIALPLILLLTIACSTNPATGRREFNIVSESQEIALGQQSHPEILKQFGVYREKPELNRMVEEVGRRIAATSDRPNLPWTFTLLDTPMVNAMALPGGYIYITRGMMEHINSEDELAGVLGHEIAHVTARHSAQQISRSQLAQFGMLLGAVIAGPEAAQQYGQLAEVGLGLLFQRYSRSQETQADLFGTRYMARSQFNPIGAEQMLMTLQRLDKNPATGIDRYFLSHPDPAKRVGDVRSEIQTLRAAGTIPSDPPNRSAYVRMLDGVMTGASTERVVIRNNTIYDRSHGLIMPVPSGWLATAAPGSLFGMQPRGRSDSYFVAQEVENRQLQGANVQSAVRSRLQQMGLSHVGSREASTRSGQRFPIDAWIGQTQSGQVGVETTQFPHGDHVAVFLFVAPNLSRTQSPLGDVLERTSVDPGRARAIQPPRIQVGTVRSGDSWAGLARRATGNAANAEALANMNGFDVRTAPPPGIVVKLPEEVVAEE